MNQYISILLWIGFMAFMANQRNFTRKELVCGEEVYRYSWVFALVAFVPVVWMAGNRGYFADTTAYINGYRSMPQSFSGLYAYAVSIKKDKGFYILSALFKCITGSDYKTYLMAIAIFQGISLVFLFRKYSPNYLLSIFLFIASTDYISWMYNGIRQFMAVAIILFAVPFMLEKKYIQAILIILVASTMHQSALLMIPFMFISQGKAWNKKTILCIVLALIAVFYVDKFTDILDDTLSNTQYVNVVSDYTEWDDDGTNPFRVAVYCIPAVFAFIGRKYILSKDDLLINFCTNMSILSASIYLVSMVTSGIFIGRLPIYCSLFEYILLPWEIDNLMADTNNKIFVYVSTVVGFCCFYYFLMHYQNGMI